MAHDRVIITVLDLTPNNRYFGVGAKPPNSVNNYFEIILIACAKAGMITLSRSKVNFGGGVELLGHLVSLTFLRTQRGESGKGYVSALKYMI